MTVPARCAAIATGLLLVALRCPAFAAAEQAPILIECAGLFDGVGDRTTGPTRVLVRDGRIAEVGPAVEAPAGAERIALARMTLSPGLIDAHTHLSYSWNDTTVAPDLLRVYLGSPIARAFDAARNAETTLLAGFTTVREMGTDDGIDVALAEATARGVVNGPRVVSAGVIYPPAFGRRDITWPPDGTVATRDEIVKKTREHLGSGCEWIKMYVTSGTYDDTTGTPYFTTDEIQAAVETAGMRGRWVAAHAMGRVGARNAVAAGVRSIEHGSRLDDEIARQMARKKIYLVPTLFHLEWYERHGEVMRYAPGYSGRLQALQKEQFSSVARARRAGVRIACGSDAVFTMHGENAWEIVWLVKAGLTPAEALRAATSVNADLLGLGAEIGRVGQGYAADLVAFQGDPIRDIEVVTHVTFVMKGGRVCKRP